MSNINIESPVTGTVWQVEKKVGDKLNEGDIIMILESMKMEVPVEASSDGTLIKLNVQPEDVIEEDQILCVIEQ